MLDHPLHPIVVHFPIALLFTAVFFEIFGFWARRESYRQFGLWLLILGFISGIVASAAGFWGEEAVVAAGVPEKAVDQHETLAVVTLVVFALLLFVRWRVGDRWSVRNRTAYFILAVVGVLLLGTTGYFGGDLVYRYGAGVQKQATASTPSPNAAPTTSGHDGRD
ncbi:MAG TPA: DUF2231 domain-containing protein [Nitrospiria bacterium]|nr:DUF2231 domain-containing protein [Nitrospiria bacterium]